MEKIGQVVMNYDYYSGTDLYSDGTIEDTLLEIVQNHEKSEFPEIIVREKSWPILYHLSEVRTNILNWYPFEKNAHVLEVGAGCGAITGAIAEKVEKVVAVDLSKKRSMINAYRNKDKDNLEIMVGNFNDIAAGLTEKFDYVTLIGVLEYGECYIPGEDSYHTFLRKISELLKPGGKVLIAIENQLGLKYFAGCREDHFGKYFEGIEGYRTTSGVKTFSKKVLTNLLEESGYEGIHFSYPFPDYKLPTTIYTDDCLPVKGELVDNMRNFDANRMVVFEETKAWDTILDAGLFGEFSNSFFVEAVKHGEEKEEAKEEQTTIFAKCSVERKEQYKLITRIYEQNGKKIVEKDAVGTAAIEHVNRIAAFAAKDLYLPANVCAVPCEKLAEGKVRFPYIEGKRLDQVIDEAVQNKQWDNVWESVSLLKDIITNVKEKEAFVMTEDFKAIFGEDPLGMLNGQEAAKGVSLDMVSANIILSDQIYVLDYEWNFDFAIPLKFILYRSILLNGTLNVMPEEQKKKMMELVDISEKECELFLQMEISFQKYVTGTSLNNLYKEMPVKAILVREENLCDNPKEMQHGIIYRALRKGKRLLVAATKRG